MTEAMPDSAGSLHLPARAAGRVAASVENIAATSAQQSSVLAGIDATVLQLDAATQQNAALAEQLAAAAAGLQERAGELQAATRVFDIGDGQADDVAVADAGAVLVPTQPPHADPSGQGDAAAAQPARR